MPDTYSDLFLGYTVLWLVIACFLINLGIKQFKLHRRIEEIQAEAEKH